VTQVLQPQTSMERAVLALLERDFVTRDGVRLADHPERVGSDFAFVRGTTPWFIRIDRIPGGNSGRIEGRTVIDLEVFSDDYLLAESVAFDLEALALGYPHVVEVEGRKVVFDDVTQNVGVADLPWEDDSVYRLGATYVITARRR
jgi:hypothetical protein